ncbi:MAG: DUF3619 family protein [Alistipes senegalensis]|nr:DUF3619 family protein [Oxalobacter formigenes]MCM1281893.1 DUF3619 family protein [Alistipes senegalensis]
MNAQEKNFAYKVRHALNERLDDLPGQVTARLAKAREMAVARKRKPAPVYVAVWRRVFAGVTGNPSGEASWLGSLGLPALVLALGLMGIVHYEEQRQIRETAAVDMAMLSDELPPAAYTDIGFSAYLERHGA